MKKLILAASLVTAFAVGGTVAQADHSTPTPNNNSHNHTQKHRCGIVPKSFVVSGAWDSSTTGATQNTDGTWSGPLTFNAAKGNRHARKSGAVGHSVTYTLNHTKVSFDGVTDGNADNAVGFDDLVATDTIRLIGKIKYAKKGGHGKNACSNPFGTDRFDDPANATIRKIVVHRPTTP